MAKSAERKQRQLATHATHHLSFRVRGGMAIFGQKEQIGRHCKTVDFVFFLLSFKKKRMLEEVMMILELWLWKIT